MLSSADIERRLLAVLAEPVESAEGRKCALLDGLRVLGRAGDKHVIAGDLGLSLRAMAWALSAWRWRCRAWQLFPGASCKRSDGEGELLPPGHGDLVSGGEARGAGAGGSVREIVRARVERLAGGQAGDANAACMVQMARKWAVEEAARLLEQIPRRLPMLTVRKGRWKRRARRGEVGGDAEAEQDEVGGRDRNCP